MRYCIVALADHERAWMVVTARDMDDSARRRRIGPSTLIRMLALAKLREEADGRKTA